MSYKFTTKNGDALKNVKVYIENQLCGTLPSKTEDSKWYRIKCHDPLVGNTVKLVTTQNMQLALSGIKVSGYNYIAFGDAENVNIDKSS